MIVEVARTSSHGGRPHECATLREVMETSVYTGVNDLNRRMIDRGANRREDDRGYILVDYPDKAWLASFESLEEAIRTLGAGGEVVVGKSPVVGIEWRIEIYDDYRE